jgi:predicted nuclease of predicted toxin-antitoxin system
MRATTGCVSKDKDFQRLSVLHGAPPKVVWVRSGNSSTADVIHLLRHHRRDIDRFPTDAETTFLAIA